LAGDQQADLRVHGGPDKAVYAYSLQNIEYWRKYLDRDDLGPGSFGENLTVEGLLDDEIAIGDELEIGTARFVVTQPRLPCFKLGIALGMPEFPRVFHRSGRNGFYLRVLKAGAITSGDEIRRFDFASRARMSIAEFVRLSGRRDLTPAQLDRILTLDALPSSWKEGLIEKVVRRGMAL
jgi:MOSC domain-containing protein YiiM